MLSFHKMQGCQRQKLSRAAKSVNRECGTESIISVGSGELLSRVAIEFRDEFFKRFIVRLSGCINHYAFSRPSVIFAALHIFPRRKNEASHARRSGLDAPPMLKGIGTNYLNVNAPCLCVASQHLPCVPRQLNRIARIRNHAHTKVKTISGDAIRQTIALAFHNNSAQIS
jgi:hypothetical protein